MRIIVISQDVGVSAVGIVAERLLVELSKICEVDLVVSNYNPELTISVKKLFRLKRKSIHYKVDRWLFDIFGTDLFAEAIKKKIILQNEYDYILSIGANGQYYGLLIGAFLHKKYKIRWANYFVDAIPAPIGWSKNNLHYKRTSRLIQKTLREVDLLASVNQEMLDYQKKMFKNKSTMKSVVLLPPAPSTHIKELKPSSNNYYRFLYAGNIYGKRTSAFIIAAFEELYKEISNVELIFVGSALMSVVEERCKYGVDVQNQIKTLPFANDLEPYYKDATALIDIDANVDNDIFLSSKMPGYLSYNRPIICETGINSPSRRLFSNLKTVIQCDHNKNELKNAMIATIKKANDYDYSERQVILNQFNACNIARKLYNLMQENK